ncbi:hypothetical protein ERO13_D10G181900v2 [Gossypium hirsutum]|uniref:Uncharacterized protein n=4 Tax=Gossypium TaxID=3633 RepID=A0A0D2TAZ2_GOSRA|nr:hypothetical protein ES319_D10G203200v1 [Gossypium barbadense]KAG4126863.1 hypothetical protein ERO13_D10G181900v2 [Gossypium hirsutum]KJB72898.1 hypothetical protein B456_011G203500 [Gossypium raimondii]TYG50980.1 hypothetical protein ES288_D10G219100v1 [Gossypium darwinii]TYI61933.1 hypothetical protein E1A91_D10G207900v1 [Gossypium mustelinum]
MEEKKKLSEKKAIHNLPHDQPALMDGIMMMKVKQVLLKNEFQFGAAATSIATCSS